MSIFNCWSGLFGDSADFTTLCKLFFTQAKVIGIGLANKMNNIFALRSFAEEDNLLFDFIDGVLVNKRVAQIGFFDIFGDIQVPFPEFFVLRTILLDIDQQYYGALGELN